MARHRDRRIGNFLPLTFLPLHALKDSRDKVFIASLLSFFILNFLLDSICLTVLC